MLDPLPFFSDADAPIIDQIILKALAGDDVIQAMDEVRGLSFYAVKHGCFERGRWKRSFVRSG